MATEVGSISIRVKPDTDKFRSDLQKSLDAAEKEIHGDVEVDAELNDKEMQAKFKALLAKMQADADKAQTKLPTPKLPDPKKDPGLQVGLDPKFDFKLHKALSKLKPEEIPVAPQVNTDDFSKAMKSQLASALTKINTKIPLTADGEKFRLQVEAQVALLTKSINAKIPIDPEIAAASKAKILAEIESFKKLASFGNDPGTKKLGNDLDNLATSAEGAGSSLASLGSSGALIGAVLAAAAPAVGLISGLIAGLPSLAAAGGTGIGTLIIATKGFGDAIKNMDDPAKFADSLKTLAPAAATTATALKALNDGPFKAFQQSLQQNLFQGFGATLDKVGAALPALTPAFNSVASGLNDIANGFLNVVTSSGGMAIIQNIVSKTGDLFKGLSPIVGSFTDSFLNLANAGANSFQLLLTPLQTFANGFSSIITQITSDGSFNSAMQGLSTVLSSVLTLFNQLFSAGVKSMGELGGPISNLISGLGNALVAAMPALTAFSAFIGNVGGALGNALVPILNGLTPAFTTFANTLGTLFTSNLTTITPLLGQLADALGNGLSTALTAIQPLLPGLVTSFSNLVTAISGQLPSLLPTIATAFGQVAGALLQIGPTVLTALATAFTSLVPSISQLAPLMPQIATAFTTFLTSVTPLIPQLLSLATSAVPLVANFLKLSPAILPLATAFLALVSPLGGVADKLLTLPGPMAIVTTAANTIKTGFADMVTAVVSSVGNVVSAVSGLGSKVLSAVGNMGTLLVASGKALIQGFIDGIGSMAGAVVNAAKGVLSKVRDLFPFSPAKTGPFSGSGWVDKSGMSVGQAFGDGLQQGFQGVVDQTKATLAQVQDAINNGVNVDPKVLSKQLTDASKAVSLESSQLKVDLNNTTDPTQKKDIRGQRTQLQQLTDQLTLQKKQVGAQKDLTAASSDTTDQWGDLGKKIGQSGLDIGKGVIDNTLGDVGIGGGAISAAFNQAWGLIPQLATNIFHVSSVGEAMTAQQTLTNQQSMQFIPR